MNKYAKMLLRDRRNPYGSRGGYVVSGGRRDRDYDRNYGHGDMRRDYDDYGYDMARDRGDMRRDYEHDYSRRDMGMDYRDYATYHDYPDHEYRHDMVDHRRYMRDYGAPEMFTKKDIDAWESMMKNEDGTRGSHFRTEQVKRACESAGIDCEEFGDDVFDLAMNMQYSDYCKVAKKYGVDRPEFYADMAKAFLRDKDFEGKPEEKLYLYYKTIVEKDD